MIKKKTITEAIARLEVEIIDKDFQKAKKIKPGERLIRKVQENRPKLERFPVN